MVKHFLFAVFLLVVMIGFSSASLHATENSKKRIAVVSSYHPEYIWSQQTNKGVISALLEFGYLDSAAQGDIYTRTNKVESSRAVLLKLWMDTKRKNSKPEIAVSLSRISKQLDSFKPDIILLGDDNAANYIGNHYLDTETPVVFWGVNGLPLKYGLLDSVEKPGHNITGIYQAGYHYECVDYLQQLLPHIKTIAVLSDDSPTGRSHAKKIKRYGDDGSLPVKIIKVVITNSYSEWQREALNLEKKVDAFFISTHNTLKDDNGRHVNYLDAAAWYLENIRKPDITPASFMVKEGFLSTVDDSGFMQGYEATKVAHSILSGEKRAADISSYAPGRGPFIINRWRAEKLGLDKYIKQHGKLIDEIYNESAAWQHKQKNR